MMDTTLKHSSVPLIIMGCCGVLVLPYGTGKVYALIAMLAGLLIGALVDES